jgi:hypothetical protein
MGENRGAKQSFYFRFWIQIYQLKAVRPGNKSVAPNERTVLSIWLCSVDVVEVLQLPEVITRVRLLSAVLLVDLTLPPPSTPGLKLH